MTSDIRLKLEREFQEPITTERQVVYIMVEVRKLLELTQLTDKYPTLMFFCNWAAHPMMDRGAAKEIVRLFDKQQHVVEQMHPGVPAGTKIEMHHDSMVELEKILSLSTFRDQFAAFLEELGLRQVITAEESWTEFLTHYGAVIQDCPLRCKDSSFEFTNEVVVRVADIKSKEDSLWAGYRLAIQWECVSTKTGVPTLTQSFFK